MFLSTAVAAGALVAGCGGDGSASPENEDPGGFRVQADTTMEINKFSKARFIARSNAFCREAWPIIDSNFTNFRRQQKHRDNPAVSEKTQLAHAIRIVLTSSIDFYIFDNIHILGAPKGGKADTERIIGELQEAVERGQRLGPLYSSEEVIALFSDYNREASGYGLADCLVDERHLSDISGL